VISAATHGIPLATLNRSDFLHTGVEVVEPYD
jgi:hypothetical protein